MSLLFNSETEDALAAVPVLARRLVDLRLLRRDFGQEMLGLDGSLEALMGQVNVTNLRLAQKHSEPRVPAPAVVPDAVLLKAPEVPAAPPAALAVAPAQPGMTLEDFKLHMGEILKGSLDAVSDKLSDRISVMLKELGTLSGPARAMRIEEFKQSGEYDMVDFSGLYSHQPQVTSNLTDVGVDEKETKGVGSTLERLRKLRAGKPKIG
ncbi:MAG: hypothetical protein HQL20_05330 [Candidatus Omnitrophica bacterium]|nr:hypothetical protein [Candidatus Omnitrophota bacterium]